MARDDTSWRKYVRAPKTALVSPFRIVSTLNNVTNADALLSTDSKYATLSRADGSANTTSPTITIDFGINVVGFPIFTFAGASSNNPGIRVAFSETKEYLTDRSDFTRSDNGDTITSGTDQHAVPADASVWTDVHGCQASNPNKVCADGLHGFRYMKVWLDALAEDAPLANPSGEVKIQSVQLNYTALRGTPDTFEGWFECEDEELTQYWYDAAYTNDMNIDLFLKDYIDPRNAYTESLDGKQVLFDGAKRDRDPYIGDLAVSGRTLYLTHPKSKVAAKNMLVDLANHQRSDGWIPPASINDYALPLFDYPLWWVLTSYDYVLYTGDKSYLDDVYPNLVKLLDTYYPSNTDNTTNLLFKGDPFGTSGYGDYAFLPRNGSVTYYNALYVYALKAASEIATWAGREDTSDWKGRADTVTTALNANLWDDSAGAYLDSTLGPVRHAQDGNSIAILSGAAPANRSLSALTYLSKHMHQPYGNAFYDAAGDALGTDFSSRVYAFISYFENSARFETNLSATAVDQIKRTYGWMASQDPGVTMWEGIGKDGSYYEEGFTSCAHGWSTGVLPALTNYVLGMKPTGPGFSTFAFKPVVTEGVTWAKGVVPTPGGGIGVDWSGKVFKVSPPKGVKGSVSVPAESKGTVSVGKGVVWENGVSKGLGARFESGYVTVDIDGGKEVTVSVK
ncbi:Six-hairpin glycosidase [Mytilinidion resinicola]|uniref:Six-hairpin glycosidase n=1 Tax=Mytilinidion resinicola TaxID=574789 RepID=A0A6A6YFN1_9PEZI|nr:Six-hairpin glycosidase [Mytilinidion resinicola]KAF2807378.1 Six-hairpin glycosidase [Mytilinidion resinicola]